MSEEDQYQKAVGEIITDLKDRRGFDQFWHGIDSDIKDEIKETHRDILKEYFDENDQRSNFTCPECGVSITLWHGHSIVCEHCDAEMLSGSL